MNQIEAINDLLRSDGFDKSYMRVWICSDCMNDILDSEEMCSEIDLGTIKIEQDIARCEIISYIDGHEYRV